VDSSHDWAGVPVSFLAVLIAFGRSWVYWEGSLAKIFGGILISVQYGGFLDNGWLCSPTTGQFVWEWTVILRDTQTLKKSTDLLFPVKAFHFLASNTWVALWFDARRPVWWFNLLYLRVMSWWRNFWPFITCLCLRARYFFILAWPELIFLLIAHITRR